jgi:hypothetical protein
LQPRFCEKAALAQGGFFVFRHLCFLHPLL